MVPHSASAHEQHPPNWRGMGASTVMVCSSVCGRLPHLLPGPGLQVKRPQLIQRLGFKVGAPQAPACSRG